METNKLYLCHYTSIYSPASSDHRYSFVKFNNEITLVCDTPFKRGDVIRVVGIDHFYNKIHIEVVEDSSLSKDKLPIMLFLGTSIPIDESLTPVPEYSNQFNLIFSRTTTLNHNKFYIMLIGANTVPMSVYINYMKDNTDEIGYTAKFEVC